MYNKIKKAKGKKMCTFIKIEYVVANALCELLENNNERSVSFDLIKDYGIQVEKVFSKNNDVKAVFLFSNEYKKEFLRDYSDLFEIDHNKISLRENVTTNEIRARILAYASFDLLKALFDKSAIEKLGLKNA